MGRAYRREPWFESLIKRDWTDAQREKRDATFTVADLHALRLYREVYEGAERSETRSCLNVSNARGSQDAAPEPSIAIVRAREYLRSIETLLGPLVATMRAVALLDKSYAQVAMGRFGSRNLDVYDDATGRFISKPAPRSGVHSVRIKAEFADGCRLLTVAVEGMFGRRGS